MSELIVPEELGDEFQDKIGMLDWEFMIEEFPVEDTDPQPPQTGDASAITLSVGMVMVSVVGFVMLLILIKRKQEEEEGQCG